MWSEMTDIFVAVMLVNVLLFVLKKKTLSYLSTWQQEIIYMKINLTMCTEICSHNIHTEGLCSDWIYKLVE